MAKKKLAQQYENGLGLSMMKTISSSEIPTITKDMMEVTLDAILQNGILKDIPVISTITGITKTILSIRDQFLVKKILSFLFELQDITDKEREKFIHDMDNDTKYQQKIGESLIMLIERLDDLEKPAFLAKLLKARIRGDINHHQFLRFASVIDQMLIQDLKNFLNAISDNTGPEHFAEYLYRFGLSHITFDDTNYIKAEKGISGIFKPTFPPSFRPETPIQFQLNQTAFLLAQILLNEKVGYSDYIADNRKQLQIDADKDIHI
jgi:hypothetical protein